MTLALRILIISTMVVLGAALFLLPHPETKCNTGSVAALFMGCDR